MRLSILICTVPSRFMSMAGLIDNLEKQAKGKSVEILYLGDNKCRTVGKKRSDLLNIASGDYVCFIDDDDKIANNYVDEILNGTNGDPDCVVFKVEISEDGRPYKPVFYDKDFQRDMNYLDKYERLPNHLMVIKKDIAIAAGFPDKSVGEDFEYAKRILKQIKTQNKIDKTLYYYNFSSSNSETQK